ncbi:MAG: CDP-glycerol glycerophosphotransferase family protein [Lachnospiraceae bacterium]|nr:CDP-glycerol glycerophosphotransferase family protein [Lachnospiraceae bacterium]
MALLLPIRRRIVVFMSSLGRNYSGNPRAICEEMARQGLTKDFRCYYIFDKPKRFRDELPQGVHALKNARFFYYFVMAMAGVWVSDTRFQNYMVKRRKTLYIQTWHGTPLKKLALDLKELHMAGGQSLAEYKEEFCKNSATWDYLISQNPFSSGVFRRAFAFRGKMLEIGYPRNDILYRTGIPSTLHTGFGQGGKHAGEDVSSNNNLAIGKLRKELGISDGKKVMLYAPTWRDNSYYNERDYCFGTELDFVKMKEAFGDTYILVVKYHYMVWEESLNLDPDFVRVVGDGVDIAKLYLIADLLITDYSSVMFDYSILLRPMYFYAYDLQNYRDTLRGFYFDFEREAPGPIVTSTDELIEAIRSHAADGYQEQYRRFVEKYNPFDDGNAAGKVVELIREHSIHPRTMGRMQD